MSHPTLPQVSRIAVIILNTRNNTKTDRVLDAYGHISVRHPTENDRFLMARNMPPATVSSAQDIVEYYVRDASPVNPDSPNGYVERFIHSEIYKKYPHIKSVVHSHSHAVIPYSISGT